MISYTPSGILSKEISLGGKLKTKTSLTLFCMAAGTKISEHTSAKEGFVYVLEGRGTFNLEGRKIEMAPGVLILLPSQAVHSLRAEENCSFALFLNPVKHL